MKIYLSFSQNAGIYAPLQKIILNAAMAAPSACNTKPWEIIVTHDKKIIDELKKALPMGRYNTPCAITVCSNTHLCRHTKQMWVQDCCAAMQNILLAATALGLGSLWIGVYGMGPVEPLVKKVKKVLNLSEHVFPLGIAYIGYTNERKEPRTNYDAARIYQEQYDPPRKHKARPKNMGLSKNLWLQKRTYKRKMVSEQPNKNTKGAIMYVPKKNTLFMDEIQEKYEIKGMRYTPPYYADAGLFLKSLFKLTDDELDRLELYLKADTDIKNAYFIVQELSLLYHLRDYEAALNYLARLETEVLWSGIKEMVDVLHTAKNWLPYIMNYFIHRITNGRTEGKNHLLRVIDKMGFPYGLDSIQACIYAHDRKQEYVKWQKHMYKRFKRSASAA